MFTISLLQFFSEGSSSSVHLLVECFEALHRGVIGVFGQILNRGFENDMITFEEKFMGAMRTHNPRMTPKVHVLVHHAPEYVRRTGVQLGPTSEQALSQCIFLTLTFSVYQLRSSLTIKSNFYVKSICLGT